MSCFRGSYQSISPSRETEGNFKIIIEFVKRLTVLFFALSWIYILVSLTPTITEQQTHQHTYSLTAVSNQFINQMVKIIFFGDSMVQKPIQQQQLIEKFNVRFPSTLFNFTNSGKNGQKIKELKQRLYRDVISQNPAGVILFWDSDVSSTENSIFHLMQSSVQSQYENDLRDVVRYLHRNVSFVLVAGPIVLGEGPLFKPRRFDGRNGMLDLYSSINERVCRSENVTFVNFRSIFEEATPVFWLISQGFLTKDGEHGNYRGTKIIVDEISNKLADWLSTSFGS